MNVVIVGSGYVGLVTGCCLAEAGNQVVCVDHDARKVAALQNGRVPFHEPGLDAVLQAQLRAQRMRFETSIARAMQGADIVFLAVGTPPQEDGNANLDNLLRCTHELASTAFEDCVVVIKSTVPVGTGDAVEAILNEGRRRYPGHPRLSVVSNPEFLAEGRAVEDFRHPGRVVIGSDDIQAIQALKQLYSPFVLHPDQLLVMDRRSAEFAKYACNAMLAARISMVNELAALAGELGADIAQIGRVLRTDKRIGASYLQPGAGYGGSCLPKDLHALIYAAQRVGHPTELLRGVQVVNQRQRDRLLEMIRRRFDNSLAGRRIAIWGLSFKPGTDDVRAAPSLTLIRQLLSRGAKIQAYDPVANAAAWNALSNEDGLTAGDSLRFGDSANEVCQGADALVLMTEWDEFRHPDFERLASTMHARVIFDARGCYDGAKLNALGFEHYHLAQATEALRYSQQNRRSSDAGLPRTGSSAPSPDTSGPN